MTDQPEHRLSKAVDALLDRILVGDFWHTAIDHSGASLGKSEQAQMAWRQRQSAMGIKPSHLDFYIYQRDTGIYAQFELKRGRNGPTEGQKTTMRLLTERGIPTGCAWSLPEFFELVVKAGFRLHPNAPNVLAEMVERLAAMDRAAELKAAKPRKVAKPRAAKPTSAAIARSVALRGRVRH